MNTDISQFAKLKISEDKMQAILYLSSTPDAEGISHTDSFTVDSITDYLNANNVKAGIDKALLKAIVIDKLFDRPNKIAQGVEPVDGVDGSFEYHFNTMLDNKPKILSDGSVDYKNIDIYEPVAEGTEVVTYTPATAGHYGYNVCGEMLPATAGKNLTRLSGSGFTISEDGNHYYSSYNGKVELINDRLVISNILDIKGDVDMTTGNIVFNGDLVISGSVLTGSTIRVTGNVTIMGNVEGASIFADGNIEIKSGMQGGGKGSIECSGELWGKFFEQATINVKGDLHANSMMNCVVSCGGNIYVSGRHGCIVGGNVSSQGSIEVTVLGNLAEVATNVNAGVNDTILTELKIIEEKIAKLNESIDKHSVIKEKLDGITNPVDVDKYNEMVEQVNNSMIELGKQLGEMQNELDQKLFLLSTYSNSSIKVTKYMYPNVNVVLSGLHFHSTDTFVNVTLKAISNSVHVVTN